MKEIILTQGKKCKCPCGIYHDNDNKNYWYNKKENIVYITDCHESNPIKAKGKFNINNKIIIQ
jgi:hypothetical protein